MPLPRDGEYLRLKVAIEDFRIWIRAWQAQVGRLTLYLLDINDPANTPVDRCITSQLYGGGPEQRLQLEMLLGIGGWRLLEALGIEPDVCHLNEGYAALAVIERARAYMEKTGRGFQESLATTRAGNIFTTHTRVPAGFDKYEPSLVARILGYYTQTLGIGIQDLLAFGRENPEDEAEPFNMAYLAIRGSAEVNGVSRLHGEVSRNLFAPLFPGWPIGEVPVSHVTNGVHMPSWDSAASDAVWTDACQKNRWVCEPQSLERGIRKLGDADLWTLRSRNRAALISYSRNEDGIPSRWVAMVRENMASLTPYYSTNRMVRDYSEDYYIPAAAAYQYRTQNGGHNGRTLYQWWRHMERYWGDLHFGELQVATENAHHRFQVPVYLGEISPDSIQIELYAEPLQKGEPPVSIPMAQSHPLTGAMNGFLYTSQVCVDRPAHHFTPRILPHHECFAVPQELNRIFWFR